MKSSSRRAFTLVELLVVIGIIGLLISILLPTLSKVRQTAIRTQCMSNQRQMLLGLDMYRSASDGKIPHYMPDGNMAGSAILRYESGDWQAWQALPPSENFPKWRRNVTEHGWYGMGMVYLKQYIKDGRVFYCPTHEYLNYDTSWSKANAELNNSGNGRIWGGYLYRIAGHGSAGHLPAKDAADERRWIEQAINGKFKGVKSLTMDFFGYNPYMAANWPHRQPYGLVVGWTDGHVTFVPMDRKDWYIIAGYKQLGDPDKHMHMLFRWGFDEDNMRKVRAALNIK
jgi:prepilin-type N-terminal cleavage/methylation domain-containing protein